MHWKKLGVLYCPSKDEESIFSHAAYPNALPLDGAIHRVFFSSRDPLGRGTIRFVDIDLSNPIEARIPHPEPVLRPGPLGTFDDSGLSVGCVVKVQNSIWIYYVGWNLGVTVPWRNSIGLAIADDIHSSFRKVSSAPILDRNAIDPYSLSYPWVMKEGSLWRMWYGSNLSWGTNPREMVHVIKYAESENGIDWQREGKIAIGIDGQDGYAVSKPCVVRAREGYRMWYSHRGDHYQIGYAESPDGLLWSRLDHQAGLIRSEVGWDSEMTAYPHVFDYQSETYMLYNGNEYGKSGFGLAVADWTR